MLHSQHHMFAARMCLRAEFPSWCNGPGHLQLRRTRRESLLPHICELTMLPSLHTPFRRADANLISEHSEWQMRHLRCVRPACRVVSAWPAPLGACLCLLLLVCRPGAGSESTCVRGRRCRSRCGPLWPLLAMPWVRESVIGIERARDSRDHQHAFEILMLSSYPAQGARTMHVKWPEVTCPPQAPGAPTP